MEKEDKIIKEFLENGFFEKAPEGFTDKVMQSVEQVELQQKPEIFSGVLGYVLLTVWGNSRCLWDFILFRQHLYRKLFSIFFI